MVFQTGPRVVRSNSCKGPVYPGKGPNKYFGASKHYLGPNFWNLAPQGLTWQPCLLTKKNILWLSIWLPQFTRILLPLRCGIPYLSLFQTEHNGRELTVHETVMFFQN